MRVIHGSALSVVGIVFCSGFVAFQARADQLYSVADLGSASPSAAYLSGQSQLDPSGNYLSALSGAQQAPFQAGSFDVFAHPATADPYRVTFFMESGGDVVRTNYQSEPEVIISPTLVTSNNLGINAGFGTQDNYAQPSFPFNELVTFKPDMHTVTYALQPQYPWLTTTMQSPGFLTSLWAYSTATTGLFQGTVSGINDHGILALTEHTYPSPSFALVQTPRLLNGTQGDISLGNLGGVNGVANALNNANQVVGWSQIASGAQHAFLYSNGSMQDLNLLIPPLSGITLISAVGIDAAGEIVAYGTNASGQMHEYYLTPLVAPVPEPSTLVFVGMATAGLALRHVRSRRVRAMPTR